MKGRDIIQVVRWTDEGCEVSCDLNERTGQNKFR